MHSIGPILEVLLPVAVGIVLAQTGLFSSSDGKSMRNLCIRFTIPQLVFYNMYKTELSQLGQAFPMVLALILLTAGYFVVGWVLSKRFKDVSRRSAVHAAVTFGNYGWIGWAVARVFLGPDGFTRAVFFTLLWWPVFYGFGLVIGLLHCGKDEEGSPWKMMLKMASPAITAIVLGTVLNYARVTVPAFLDKTINSFGSMSIPLILLSVGIELEFRNIKSHLIPAASVSFARLCIGPFLGLLAVLFIRLFMDCDETSAKVILLESSMPVATMTPVLADNFKLDNNVAGAAIVLSTIISLVSVPMWLELLGPFL